MSRRVLVLLSGTGRSLANLIAARNGSALDVEFVGVISNRPQVRGLMVAEKAGIPHRVVDRKDFDSVEAFSGALTAAIEEHRPDLIVMAGFLCFYTVPEAWAGRVINIHPSLLPSFGGKGFYGDRVHRAVLESGVRVSGCTVHFVDNEYDNGAPILQLTCPVMPDDSIPRLGARVFARECEALPRAIDWCLSGTVELREGRAYFTRDMETAEFR